MARADDTQKADGSQKVDGAPKKIDLSPENEKEATKPKIDDPGSATPIVISGSTKDVLPPQQSKVDIRTQAICVDYRGYIYLSDQAGYESCISGGGDSARPPSDNTHYRPGIGIWIGR